jgi:hypothetical protein
MTQPSRPDGRGSRPGSGQPPAASTESPTPGAQPVPPGAQPFGASPQPVLPGAQPFGASPQPVLPGAPVPPGSPVPAGQRSPAVSAGGASRLARLGWASVPVWSLGFLAFAPFLRLAVARRGRKDWAIFAGYLLAVILEIVVVSVAGTSGGLSAAAGGLVIVLMGGGAVHSYLASGGDQARAVVSGPATPERLNREALATARSRMERRREAREITSKNPVLGRELRIGRPDLAREYDDGGLVDVNQVPGTFLQSGLGLSAGEAAAVLAARDQIGRFTSADEVTTYAQLPPDRLDDVRDWMIFS